MRLLPRDKFSINFVMVFIFCCWCFPGLYYWRRLGEESSTASDREKWANPPMMGFKRVFIFGVDGIGTLASDMDLPVINKILVDGVRSFEVESVSPTMSAECWSSMLRGVEPDIHGCTPNGKNKQCSMNQSIPSLLQVAGAAGLASASIVNWRPINTVILEKHIPFNRKITAPNDDAMIRRFHEVVVNGSTSLVFVQIDECDSVGHKSGFFTEDHKLSLRRVDALMGRMIDIINAVGGDNVLIVTSDHGGGGTFPKYHGTDDSMDKTVFFGCAGPGVPSSGLPQMSIIDIPVIVAALLGIDGSSLWQGTLPDLLRTASRSWGRARLRS